MLESYKKAHMVGASIIDGWEKMNKNDLINLCVDNEENKELYDAYYNAVVCRYWNVMERFKSKSYGSIHDTTIYYDWLLDGINRALTNKSWRNKDSTLYGDPSGPDKAVNVCLRSVRLGWYHQSNYNRRRANFGAESVDKLVEAEDNGGKSYLFYDSDPIANGYLNIRSLADSFIRKGEYISALVVGCIVEFDVFDRWRERGERVTKFNKKKLVRKLNNLTKDDCYELSLVFGNTREDVESMVEKCKNINSKKRHLAIDWSIKKIEKFYFGEA